jgi:hypothetical protein
VTSQARPGGKPRRGRVRLRPNRGFPLGLALQRHPSQILARIGFTPPYRERRFRVAHFSHTTPTAAQVVIDWNDGFMGDEAVGKGEAESPGSGGTSPYQERRFRVAHFLSYDATGRARRDRLVRRIYGG